MGIDFGFLGAGFWVVLEADFGGQKGPFSKVGEVKPLRRWENGRKLFIINTLCAEHKSI